MLSLNHSKCGLAKTQSAYKTAVDNLFDHLDKVEAHLSSPTHTGPFYYGSSITEVDIRLYVTIVRFDTVYVNIFKTNKKTIRYGYPAIHQWLKNLYWKVPEFKDTTLFEHIKGHYFGLTILNPSGIVPDGPVPHVEPLEE
jgi:glutathionyl-hydroquinone reductase